MSQAPADEYRLRLSARRSAHARLTRTDERLSFVRLAIFTIAVLMAVAMWRGLLAPWWMTLPVIAFVAVAIRHNSIVRDRETSARAIAFYERGLARIEDRWPGGGDPGERFRDPQHLYAADLDLFGPASLFELLSIARTRAGEDTLASWLMIPADVREIHARQQAAADLNGRLDLREAMSLAGSDVRAAVHTEDLVAWAEMAPSLANVWLRPAALALTAAAIVTIGAWIASGNPRPFILLVMVEIAFSAPLRARVAKALHGADAAARDLDVLRVVLETIEREQFQASRLSTLQRELTPAAGDQRPSILASVSIRRLHWFVELHDWQHNAIFAVLAAPLLWGTHTALAIERWRRAHGPQVRHWLRICGEFEALASLAAYHYEHPQDPFPELHDDGDRHAMFDGIALGHPLIPAARMVRNDIRLASNNEEPPASPALLVVSGSNMSGKSTLLRTVGINAVLAFAGAPVRARRLRISPLRIAATLRIQDSLQEGRSRFYAEITRIRHIADLASGPAPVLFLLDELLHGTNSHDRAVGADGILRVLLERGAVGLITTHDLALTEVTQTLGSRAANVHFDDRFEAGAIAFDYVMKPGPVTRSNALALMQAVGLDVPLDVARGNRKE
jgi:hypothetical protein